MRECAWKQGDSEGDEYDLEQSWSSGGVAANQGGEGVGGQASLSFLM